MVLKEDEGTQFDGVGVVVHNYFAVNIANFNPYDGDKNKLHRSLLNSQSLIFKKSAKLPRKYRKFSFSCACFG